MRDIPELTFRGALSLLGQYDRPVVDRLNTVLGGAIMVGGAVALTGPLGTPAVALAALWGWVDQKNEAVGLVRKLLDRIGDHRANARGFDRTRLIAASHTLLVASSVVEAFRQVVGHGVFKNLEITDKELAALLTKSSDQRAADVIYDSAVPMPSAGCSYIETRSEVHAWQSKFTKLLVQFSLGLAAGNTIRDSDRGRIVTSALRRYEDQYRKLAAQVPEFLVWSLLTESGATQSLIATVREDVRKALDDQQGAMSRLESLLGAVCGSTANQVTAAHRAARAGLDEPVVPQDNAAMSTLADIRFPRIRDIFVQPDYRVEQASARSPIANEQWWQTRTRHHDLDLRIATHLTSPEATRLPLLVLGHPGAGKSLLMKVLAARLPTDQYTTVYVPLRHVSSTAPVYEQVEQALKRETNGRADWAGLAHQSPNTTLVVLLDGLDELLQATDRDRGAYLHDVAAFQRQEATQGNPVVVLVTSRTLVADRVDVPSRTTVIKLEEFDRDQIEQWRVVWNSINQEAIDAGTVRELTREAVDGQPELAQQPLLLLMLAVYSADPSFPAIESGLSKTALYRTLFVNFTQREATKQSDAPPPREQIEQLSVAALGMFNRGRQHVTDAELAADLAVLTADLSRRTDSEQRLVAQFFFVYTAEANLGTDHARRSYEFLHATFGEYLVAREVIDTLIDTADSTVGRRGEREPDDDRLFALLSHDCIAVRGPILDFVTDLLAELSPDDRHRITRTLVTLLTGARHRQGSARYAEYRPAGADHIRAIAAYSANLVLLAVVIEPDMGISADELIGDAAKWRPQLDLWRGGLATDSWHALLASLEWSSNRLRRAIEVTSATGLDVELRQAELAGDTELDLTLRMGRTIRGAILEEYGRGYSETLLTREEESLLRWLIAVLVTGVESQHEVTISSQLRILLQSISERDVLLLSKICMVLKQRADCLDYDYAFELVRYLLEENCHDTYAYIAAAGAHPNLLRKFPQLLAPEHYKGMQGTELMIKGMNVEHLDLLLDSLLTRVPSSDGAAALLHAFQWTIEP